MLAEFSIFILIHWSVSVGSSGKEVALAVAIRQRSRNDASCMGSECLDAFEYRKKAEGAISRGD